MSEVMNLSAFSETLSRLRRERGLTQAELGARLGISKSAVSMYECGNRGWICSAPWQICSA